jgi:hypothetical protein
MSRTHTPRMIASYRLLWWLIPVTVAACSTSTISTPPNNEAAALSASGPHSDRAGIGITSLNSSALVTLDPRRSLAVTDDAILASFSFKAVMDQLVAQAGVPGLTSLQLFQQWWSTAVTCPPPDPKISRFAYQCPRAEGQQNQQDPFASPPTDASYTPIGLFNRFDLAPADGADCGEYRIVFARNSGFTNSLQRNLVIFEAVLPNPNPSLGLEGCTPVAQLWADLSQVGDVNERAARLKSFYFTGLPGFEPVVHVNHYGALGKGQIRTNQFMQFDWLLREFTLQKTATSLQIAPATVKVNPFGALFATSSTQPAFVNALVAAVPSLAVNDINTFSWSPDDAFNAAQSDEQSDENDYVAAFVGGGGGGLRTAIANKLTSIGSTLTPEDIVARAQALSCAGCHELSNAASLGGGIVWPASLGFVQVSERTEQGPDGVRHLISSALTNVFLPHRAAVLNKFLPPPVCVPQTCAQQGAQCGTVSDGCNGTLVCGNCASNQSCQSNHCQCVPKTCAQQGAQCGTVSDGCNGTLVCGNCASNQICQSNHCQCVPKTCAQLGAQCGTVSDGCNGTLVCGNCASNQICQSNHCQCVPKTCAQLGAQCGTVSDGCNGTLVCGSCAPSQVCEANHCQCVPLTCADMGNQCGVWSNNCGGTVNCGTCRFPLACNNDGQCIPIPHCRPGTFDCGDGRCAKFCQ